MLQYGFALQVHAAALGVQMFWIWTRWVFLWACFGWLDFWKAIKHYIFQSREWVPPVSRCREHGAEEESCWIHAPSLVALMAEVKEKPGCVLMQHVTESWLMCTGAGQVGRPLWHVPVMAMMYFGSRYTRFPAVLCSSSAGGAQDWCLWKNRVENQHWNSMKRWCSEPNSITAWAKLGKIYIKGHLFPALRKLIAFQSSLRSWTLLPFLQLEAAWCEAAVPNTLLPVPEPHSCCWEGAKQAKCSMSF